jgi:ATP-dependent DNA helicase RecQ
VLLGYFGEPLDVDCGNCDVCLDPPELYDATIDAQKALSTVIRTGQRFGIGHVIDVLRGHLTEKVSQWDHDQLSVYGVGTDSSADEWTALIRQLIHHGYLRQDIAAFSALKFTDTTEPALHGKLELRFAKARAKPPAAEKRPKRSGALEGMDVDVELFERLRELRRTIAAEQGVPAYVVFGDRSLADMASRKPSTPEEFLSSHGVGEAKLARYGEVFLAAIAETPSAS